MLKRFCLRYVVPMIVWLVAVALVVWLLCKQV